MQNGHPQSMPRPGPATFLIASVSLVLVFAISGAPIPLFAVYREQDLISNSELGWVSVAYFFSAATALLVLGRVSNHLGRRPMALAALGCATLSCAILAGTKGLVPLFAARAVQGLACGIASSALGSYVVDCTLARARWMSAAVTGSSPMVGISLGAVFCGVLAEYGPAPRSLPYVALGGVSCVCIALIISSPETVARTRGAIASLKPRLEVPIGAGHRLMVAGATFVATWSFGGFYQAFGSSVTTAYLGTRSPLVVATVFSSILILNPLGSPLGGRLPSTTAVRLGMTVFSIAVAAIVVGLNLSAVEMVIVASLVVGLAQGVASTGALRSLLQDVQQGERAGLLSTIYLISYAGAAFPALVAGPMTRHLELLDIAIGYALLAVATSVVAIVAVGARTRP